MKKRYSRVVALLIAMIMVIGMLPAGSVFAVAGGPGTAVAFTDGVFVDDLSSSSLYTATGGSVYFDWGKMRGPGHVFTRWTRISRASMWTLIPQAMPGT